MTKATGRAIGKASPTRSLWWQLHHWCGLKLSLLMTFVLLTGTLATLSREMDWLINPALRVSVQDQPMASWGRWHEAARQALPGGEIEEISMPVGRGYAIEVAMTDAAGDDRIVYINPWSARVQGIGSKMNVRQALRQVHRHLMLPGAIGLPLVSALSIPLILLLMTAVPVYKKWWRGFLRWPRPMTRRGDGRRYAGDLHRLAGLWSFWFLALIAITGLWYLAEWAGARAPKLVTPPPALLSGGLDRRALDDLVIAAQRAMPDLIVRGMKIDPDDGIFIQGQATAILVRDNANGVLLDGAHRTAVATIRGERLTAHQRLSEAADPLHFGNWGGVASRLLWFLFGLLITLLSASGAVIYALRLKRELAWSVSVGLWRGMGLLAAPCTLLVGFALIKLFGLLR